MKSMTQQTRDASAIVLGLGIICIALSLLSGCAKPSSGSNGAAGATGATGATGVQGYGAGIKTTVLSVGNANCPNGGVQLINFQDLNNNGLDDLTDSMIGLTYVCNGANGSAGATGATGTNGVNTTFSIVVSSLVDCPNGGFDVTLTDSTHTNTEHVCNGNNGNNGQAGTNGTNGSSGGTVSFSLVQAIEPCGAASSPWKEVILGLQGGQLLSSFSETAAGQNTRFAFIPNGSYQDTDSSGCTFTVTGNGSTTSQISWNAGSNSYSTWLAGGYSWTPSTGWVAQ